MNEGMHLGPKGTKLIQSFESLQLRAYVDTREKDGSPRYGIGWGHTRSAGPPVVTKDMVITEAEANEIFARDALEFERKVKRLVKVQLNQNQFDALVSAAFNMATANFKEVVESSGLNEGNYAGVPAALLQFDKSQGKRLAGLTFRRLKESQLFTEES